MNLGKYVLRFMFAYAIFYITSALFGLPPLFQKVFALLLGLEKAGNALLCDHMAWMFTPECTGIFGLALWAALVPEWRTFLRGVPFVVGAELLRVYLSISLGCALHSTAPHVLLWLLPPVIVLILWRRMCVQSPVV